MDCLTLRLFRCQVCRSGSFFSAFGKCLSPDSGLAHLDPVHGACKWEKQHLNPLTSALGDCGVMSLPTQGTTAVFNGALKLWTAFKKSVILHHQIPVVLSGKVDARVKMALTFPHLDIFISLSLWLFCQIPSTGSSWPFKDLVLQLPFLLKKSSRGFEQRDRSGSHDSLDH